MGWPPDVVGRQSLAGFMAAYDGWARANGVVSGPPPMTAERYRELVEASKSIDW